MGHRKRSQRLLGVVLAAGLVGGLGAVARAYTGGSGGGHGGGGGFGGGGGHSYGSSRGSGGWGGSGGTPVPERDRRGPDPATRRRNRRNMMLLWGCCLFGAGTLVYLMFRPGFLQRFFTGRESGPGWGPAVPRLLHLETLTLALDWHARPAVQRAMDELAESSALGDPAARARALSKLAHLLLAHETSWLYAACTHDVVTGRGAPVAFGQAERLVRTRFTRESVRNDNGSVVRNPGAPVPTRASDGRGVIVVSVITATRQGLWPIPSAADPHAVRCNLTDRTALIREDVWALGFAWCPSEGAERMSSAAAEALFPELRLLDEAAMVGRVFCASCQGPYGLELGACPHCAAATEADTRATRQPAGAVFAATTAGVDPGDGRAHLACAYCSVRFAPEQLTCPGCARPAEPATQAQRGAGAA